LSVLLLAIVLSVLLLAIVLSVLLRFTDSDYSFGIFWPLCCLSFFDLRILIIPLVSFGHCVSCPSSIYGFCTLCTSVRIILTFASRIMDFRKRDLNVGVYNSQNVQLFTF
jgi:hypothetical protein